MNAPANTGYTRPTQQQEALLQAALLQSEKARRAFQEWKSQINLDDLDSESFRLLPKLYQNLCAQQIDDPLVPRLKGIYRKTWCENHLRVCQLDTVLETLNQAGVSPLILNGSALVTRYYNDDGVCSMADFDVLVRAAQATTAISLLQASGWRPTSDIPGELAVEFDSIHAVCFKHADGGEIGLHWRILHGYSEGSGTNSDDELWSAAIKIQFSELTAYALSPADQLLYICGHEFIGIARPPLRWAVDAMSVLQTFPIINWDHLIARARGKRDKALPLAYMLDYLRHTFDAAIPQNVLRRLRIAPAPPKARFRLRINPFKSLKAFERVRFAGRMLLKDYVRTLEQAGQEVSLPNFSKFLKQHWGAASVWQLPYFGCLRLIWLIRPAGR